MTTPLQEAFPDVDIIEGVTEFEITMSNTANPEAYQKGQTVVLDADDGSECPFFINKSNQKDVCIHINKMKVKRVSESKTVKAENGTFDIPDGYEIDTVTFKKKANKRPESWEYYTRCNTLSVKDSTFIASSYTPEPYKALRKLQLMRDMWVGDCKEPRVLGKPLWVISRLSSNDVSVHEAYIPRSLEFATETMANDFLKAHKELIEQAKTLL